MVSDEYAYKHYKEALESTLRENLKPVISSLTMLADDYADNAAVIARSIEEYINAVNADLKLLGLYLIDSIIKNLKASRYVSIFQSRSVALFTSVFRAVDEHNRKQLFKLRQTWKEVFSNATLYMIDKNVSKIDPAWPITATAEPEINGGKKVLLEINESKQKMAERPISSVAASVGTKGNVLQLQQLQQQSSGNFSKASMLVAEVILINVCLFNFSLS